jgi:hypothetical protein
MTDEQLLARLDERQQAMDEKIDAILEQTKRTNGRLLTAEERIQSLSTWRAEIKAQIRLVVILGTIIGGIAGWVLSRL